MDRLRLNEHPAGSMAGGAVVGHDADNRHCLTGGTLHSHFLAVVETRHGAAGHPALCNADGCVQQVLLQHERCAAGVLFVENIGTVDTERGSGAGTSGALHFAAEVLSDGREDFLHLVQLSSRSSGGAVDVENGTAAIHHVRVQRLGSGIGRVEALVFVLDVHEAVRGRLHVTDGWVLD